MDREKRERKRSGRVVGFAMGVGAMLTAQLQGQEAAYVYDQVHDGARFGLWILGTSMAVKYLFYRHVVRNIPRAITCLLTVEILTMLIGGLIFSVQSRAYLLPTPVTWVAHWFTLSGEGMIEHATGPFLFSLVLQPILLFVLFHPSRSQRVWILIPAANVFSVLIERILFILFEWIA